MAMRQTLIRLIAAVLLLVATAVAVEAQEPTRVWRVGFLGSGSHTSGDPRVEALRRGLRELGYAEGRNLAFEFRWAGGNGDRLPVLAAELAKLKVDVIVTQGTQATDAARRAVTTIPIVFSVAGDPIGSGLVLRAWCPPPPYDRLERTGFAGRSTGPFVAQAVGRGVDGMHGRCEAAARMKGAAGTPSRAEL
jgi:ABC-type uncharacterized transport system substrate-binding protein